MSALRRLPPDVLARHRAMPQLRAAWERTRRQDEARRQRQQPEVKTEPETKSYRVWTGENAGRAVPSQPMTKAEADALAGKQPEWLCCWVLEEGERP